MGENQWKKNVEEKEEQLKNRVKEIGESYETNPELIAEALAFGSQFYKYSLQNTMLIFQQNPNSQYVQSFQKWKEMGVSVKRGEHGMNIFVPVQTTYLKLGVEDYVQLRYATKEQKEAYKNGELESINRTHFRIGTVFDISQTTFPKERYPELFHMGYADEKCSDLIEGLTKYCNTEMSCPVHTSDVKGIGLRGYYSPGKHEITLNHLLEDSEKLSTLTHEMGHAMIHHDPEARKKSEPMREFEADAVSVMLQTHYGIELTDSRKRHLAIKYKDLKANEQEIKLNDCLNNVYQVYKEHVDKMDQYVDCSLEKNQRRKKMKENEITVLIVRTFEEPKRAVIPNKLEVFQEIVDGDIEVYTPLKDNVAFIICEEEKRENKMLNQAIIDREGEQDEACDVIAGDFIVVGTKSDQFISLTEKQIKHYESEFHVPESLLDKEHQDLWKDEFDLIKDFSLDDEMEDFYSTDLVKEMLEKTAQKRPQYDREANLEWEM